MQIKKHILLNYKGREPSTQLLRLNYDYGSIIEDGVIIAKVFQKPEVKFTCAKCALRPIKQTNISRHPGYHITQY